MAPVVGTIGAASAKGFGWTAASIAGGVGWAGIASGTANSDYVSGESKTLAMDNAGNVYFAYANSNVNGNVGTIIHKINSDGTQLACKQIGKTSTNIYLQSFEVEPTNNYIFLTHNIGGQPYHLTQFSNTFVHQWTRLGNSYTTSGLFGSSTKFKSSYVWTASMWQQYVEYCCGYYVVNYLYYRYISGGGGGNFNRRIPLSSGGYDYPPFSMTAVDYEPGVNRVYIASTALAMTNYFYGTFMALNDSGTITNFAAVGSAGVGGFPQSLSSVSSPSTAVFSTICTTGSFSYVVKLGSTLNLLNSAKIIGLSNNYHMMDHFVDSNGDVYVCLNDGVSSGAGFKVYIFKFNSSLTLQWQRSVEVTGSGLGVGAYAFQMKPKIVCDSTNYYLYFKFRNNLNSAYVPALIKMPKDGTGIGGTASVGAYGFSYGSSSLTFNTDNPGIDNGGAPSPTTYSTSTTDTHYSEDAYYSLTTDIL